MKTIRYRCGYKYQLAEGYSLKLEMLQRHGAWSEAHGEDGERDAGIKTEYIELSADGVLTIKAGYAWDGPSGPTIDTKSFMRGSLVHDALYQLMRNEHLPASCREEADQELYRLCREDGMCRFRAWYVLLGVRKGAGFAASPKSRKSICSAP